MKQEIKYYEIKEEIEDKEIPLFNKINKRINPNKKINISKHSTGPPDLIYFVREAIKSNSYFNFLLKKKSKSQQKYKLSSSKKFGSYINIYGLDISNMNLVEKFINEYIEKQRNYMKYQKDNPDLEKLKNTEITKAIFCSYDIFMEKDFRIIFKYPDGFDKFYFYDGNKVDFDITEDELRTIYLSTILRAWNYNEENNNNKNNIIFLEEIQNNKNFNSLIDSIIFILIERLEYKYPNLEKKLGILLYWFIKYLMNTRRYSFILSYFSKLSYIDTNLSKFALKPLYYINEYQDGLKFISTLLTCNTNHLLICEEIEFLIILKKYEDAMKLGKYLTTSNPGFNEAWIKLAELYLKLKCFDKSLKALNNLNYLKTFLNIDNINYDNPYIINNEFNSIKIKEIPLAYKIQNFNKSKNKEINLYSLIKYNDLLYCSKYHIDLFYNSSIIVLSDNDDLLKDIINKILKSNFIKFKKEEKKLYYILLDIIKQINFTKFIELKDKMFSTITKKKIYNKLNINEILRDNNNNFNDNDNNNKDKTDNNLNETKILMNPYLENVINTLIEDIKLFSLGCFIKEKNESNNSNNKRIKTTNIKYNDNKNNLSYILYKNNLSKCENEFCISFGILCERLKYYKIALKYYSKILNNCFSKYVYCRIIKILLKQKDYKNCILKLNELLLYYNPKEYNYISKTPLWIDKIILEVLFEFKANDMLSWIKQISNKDIIFFIKKIINKYKEWVENGHEFHLLK